MYKVYDFWCPDCELREDDILCHSTFNEKGEYVVEGHTCPKCGVPMDRLMPGPDGTVLDAGQIASKRAMAKAFKAKIAGRNYKPGSVERKEADATFNHLMKAGTT